MGIYDLIVSINDNNKLELPIAVDNSFAYSVDKQIATVTIDEIYLR